MNKRFSTLLAAALVAGSSFSAFAAAPDNAADLKESLKSYYQLKVGGDFVVIGQGETRDSLAVWTAKDIKALEDVNKTLWRAEFKAVTGSNGQIASYEMRLFNKVGNRQLVLSTSLVEAGKTFYKSPAAVLGAEGIDKWTVTVEEYAALSTIADQDFRFIEYLYSKTADKTTKYRLAKNGNAIKLQAIVSKKQSGGAADFEQDFPTESGVEVFVPTAKAYGTDGNGVYAFAADELNAKGNDGFTLSFTKDVLNNKFANPFSAYTLHATEKPIYAAAVYNGDYATALAAVKKAYVQLDDLKAAYKGYTDGVDEAIKFLKTTGNATAADAKMGALIPNQTDLDLAGENLDECAAILASSSEEGSIPALTAAAKTALAAVAGENLAVGAKLKADNEKLVAYVAAAKKVTDAVAKLVTDTKANVDAVDAIMKAWMTPANIDNTIAWDAPESELTALTDFNTANFVTTGAKNLGTLVAALATKAVVTERKTAATLKDDYYALAIADSTIKEKQAYLTVDTNYVANREKYLTFATDTLIPATVKVGGKDVAILVAPLNKNINKYAFDLSAVVNNIATGDSIIVKTYAPKVDATTDYFKAKDGTVDYTTEAQVVIRTLGNGREVSVATDLTTPDAAVYNSKIGFAMPPYATFAKDEVFFIRSKKDADKDAFRVIAYDGLYNTTLVKSDKVFASVPATQWFVKKADAATHTYTITNRDKNLDLVNAQVYVIDAANRIYTTAAKDTFQVVAIEGLKEDAHLGYKYLNNEEQILKSFVLTAKNYANPEAYYLSVGADSAVVVTSDASKALSLTVKKATTEDTKLNDESILTREYLLASVDGKKTFYLTVNADKTLSITTKENADNMKFRRVNNSADEYEVLYNGGKLSINQDGEGVRVGMSEMTSYVFNLAEEVTEIYKNFGITTPTNVVISLNGDNASKVTAAKPFAVIKRTGLDLKAAATDNDFVLSLDTAYVNRGSSYRYAYYITKPIDVKKVGSFDEKAYMVTYADSIAHNSDTVKYDQDGLTRIGFVHAKRVNAFGNDSLAISKVKPVAADTINVVKAMGITPATFAFAIEGEGSYRIETAPDANGRKYVSYLNGVLVLGSKEQAQLFNVATTDLIPTDNETIETSSVSVIASEGQITIAGAEGKKVVISNILGQVIANTVISSSNATIAVPAGVVVVAVEGEAAVKAIVK